MAFFSQRQQHGNRAKKITRRLAARNLRFLLKYVDRDSQSELWDKALATSKQTSIVYFPLGNGKASAAQPFFRLCGLVRGCEGVQARERNLWSDRHGLPQQLGKDQGGASA